MPPMRDTQGVGQQRRAPSLRHGDEMEGDTLSQRRDKMSVQALCSKQESTRWDAALTRPGDLVVLSGFWHRFCSRGRKTCAAAGIAADP
jgi:hypothetical protein